MAVGVRSPPDAPALGQPPPICMCSRPTCARPAGKLAEAGREPPTQFRHCTETRRRMPGRAVERGSGLRVDDACWRVPPRRPQWWIESPPMHIAPGAAHRQGMASVKGVSIPSSNLNKYGSEVSLRRVLPTAFRPQEENVMQIGFQCAHTGPLIEPVACRTSRRGAAGFDYVTISDTSWSRNLQSSIPIPGPASSRGRLCRVAWRYRPRPCRRADEEASLRPFGHEGAAPPCRADANVLPPLTTSPKGRLTLGIGVGWCRERVRGNRRRPVRRSRQRDRRMDGAFQKLWVPETPKFTASISFADVVLHAQTGVRSPISIWWARKVRRRSSHHPLCSRLVAVGTNPQHPRTLSSTSCRAGTFHGFCKRVRRDPKIFTLAYRVLSAQGASRGASRAGRTVPTAETPTGRDLRRPSGPRRHLCRLCCGSAMRGADLQGTTRQQCTLPRRRAVEAR